MSRDSTRTDAPWGISRLSQDGPEENQDPLSGDFVYKFDSSAGKGVDIYVIGNDMLSRMRGLSLTSNHLTDTGINVDHVSRSAQRTLFFADGYSWINRLTSRAALNLLQLSEICRK